MAIKNTENNSLRTIRVQIWSYTSNQDSGEVA